MTAHLRPGDVVTCPSCTAQAVATWPSAERAWQEGWPLRLSWTHGPHPRHEVTHAAPEECIWCRERHAVLPGAEPLYRPSASDAGGDRQTEAAPLPPPLPAADQVQAIPSSAAPAVPSKFLELAREYFQATGRYPFSYPPDAIPSGDEVYRDRDDDPWVEWLRARNAAAAAPRKPPKGTQLGLFSGGRP